MRNQSASHSIIYDGLLHCLLQYTALLDEQRAGWSLFLCSGHLISNTNYFLCHYCFVYIPFFFIVRPIHVTTVHLSLAKASDCLT